MGKKQVVYVGLSEKSDQRFWIKASDFKKVDLRMFRKRGVRCSDSLKYKKICVTRRFQQLDDVIQ